MSEKKDQIKAILERNDGLAMDNEAEREKLAMVLARDLFDEHPIRVATFKMKIRMDEGIVRRQAEGDSNVREPWTAPMSVVLSSLINRHVHGVELLGHAEELEE